MFHISPLQYLNVRFTYLKTNNSKYRCGLVLCLSIKSSKSIFHASRNQHQINSLTVAMLAFCLTSEVVPKKYLACLQTQI